MIQLTPHMRILVAIEPVDFRKGIDGLRGVCRRFFDLDPMEGHIVVFRNRRKTAIKILIYDGQGFWLCQKRLSKGTFRWWPNRTGGRLSALAVHELQMLIWNANPEQVEMSSPCRRIEQPALTN